MTPQSTVGTGSELPAKSAALHARAGRPRDDAREQAILDASIELLCQVGYDAMSIESVAARSGTSKATIYRRWPGKAELVADAMRRHHAPSLASVADTGSLRGDLLAVVRIMFDNMRGADGGLLCGLAFAVRSDPELGRSLAAQKLEYRREIASLITSRATARGELAASALVEALTDVAPAVALFHQMSGEPLDQAFAEHLVDHVLIPLLRS